MSNVKCEDVKCLLRDRIDDDLAYAMLCLNIVKEIINVHFVFHGCVGWYKYNQSVFTEYDGY